MTYTFLIIIFFSVCYVERYNLWRLLIWIKYTLLKIPLRIQRAYYNFIMWVIDEIKRGNRNGKR